MGIRSKNSFVDLFVFCVAFFVFATFVLPANAQECLSSLGGIGADDCEGRSYEADEDASIRLMTHASTSSETFHRVPLHPYFRDIQSSLTNSDKGGPLFHNRNAWFFVSVQVNFSTRRASIVTSSSSNVTGIWVVPGSTQTNQVNGPVGFKVNSVRLGPGVRFLLRNDRGHYGLFRFNQLEILTPATSTSSNPNSLAVTQRELDTRRTACAQNSRNFHNLRVCDANLIRWRFDSWLNLVQGSADFRGIKDSQLQTCSQPQSAYYAYGNNTLTLRMPTEHFDWGAQYRNLPLAPFDPPHSRWAVTSSQIRPYRRYSASDMQFYADIETDWPDPRNNGSASQYLIVKASNSNEIAAHIYTKNKSSIRGSIPDFRLSKGAATRPGSLILARNSAGRHMLIEFKSVRFSKPSQLYHYTQVDAQKSKCRYGPESTNGYCSVYRTDISYRYWIMKKKSDVDFSCAK